MRAKSLARIKTSLSFPSDSELGLSPHHSQFSLACDASSVDSKCCSDAGAVGAARKGLFC